MVFSTASMCFSYTFRSHTSRISVRSLAQLARRTLFLSFATVLRTSGTEPRARQCVNNVSMASTAESTITCTPVMPDTFKIMGKKYTARGSKEFPSATASCPTTRHATRETADRLSEICAPIPSLMPFSSSTKPGQSDAPPITSPSTVSITLILSSQSFLRSNPLPIFVMCDRSSAAELTHTGTAVSSPVTARIPVSPKPPRFAVGLAVDGLLDVFGFSFSGLLSLSLRLRTVC
mmetsp:Transcript_26646/g.74824  ORF Transcript_26646/g.74824 Transcript_26646/m.74824 type:complete len:234 (+) Transcript_26646:2835-3536(+)